MQRAVFSFALLLVATACADESRTPSDSPLAPSAAPATPALGAAPAVNASGASTICLVFVSSRDLAKAQLDAAPTDTLLQQRVTSLNAVVADACN